MNKNTFRSLHEKIRLEDGKVENLSYSPSSKTYTLTTKHGDFFLPDCEDNEKNKITLLNKYLLHLLNTKLRDSQLKEI